MAVYNEKDKSKWTKDGRHWYYTISYRDATGKTKYKKSKRFIDKETARLEELKFKTKRDNPEAVKFKLVADTYFDNLKKIRKESTVYSYIKDYNNHIKPYFECGYINEIGLDGVRDWHDDLNKKKLSTAYKNKINNILVHIFDTGIRNFNLKDNPARTYGCFQEKTDKVIPNEKKLRYITYDEFKKFIKVVDDDMWRAFFIFAYFTGCRRGEMQALRWTDIDFKTSEITINKTLYEEVKGKVEITSTKNNINRKIKMSKYLKESLAEYKNKMKEYTDFDENWFIFGNTRFLPKTTIDRNKHKYFKLSGVHEITMHEFRHSHVSLLINEYVKESREKNMKVDTAKFFLIMSNRMGHSVQVMQETYMHLFPTIQDEVVDLLDNL